MLQLVSLFHLKFVKDVEENGFEINPYNHNNMVT